MAAVLPPLLNEDTLPVFVAKQLSGVALNQECQNGYLLPDATLAVSPPSQFCIGSGAFATACSNAGLSGADTATVQAAMNRFHLLKTP